MESPPLSSQALPSGTRIEEFVIERVLGSGGFGITYLARDTRLDRQVVIKENLPVQFCFRDPSSLTVFPRHTSGEDVDNFQWSLGNFSREAAMLASLDHPGIVRVLRSFEAFGTAYFVMPFVEGIAFDQMVEQHVAEGRCFSEDGLRGLLSRMLNTLDYLHGYQIYHRDIKPGNILITHEGIPVLIDFGSARQKMSDRSMTVVESPGYTPFEQLQSRGNVGPWSDLYSLGATLAKAITFQSPPKTPDRMMGDPWKPLEGREQLAIYSHTFLRAIDRAMEVFPINRWQTSAEWAACELESRLNIAKQVAANTIRDQVGLTVSKDRGSLVGFDDGFVSDIRLVEIAKGLKIAMCYIPEGEFLMGSQLSEEGHGVEESPHSVELSHHFWMAEHPVTQAQWLAVMNSNPSDFQHDDSLPVESVSFEDAQSFVGRLSLLVSLPGLWRWSLPTEAEWERACRGGIENSAFSFGNRLSSQQANFDGDYPYGRAPKGPDLRSTSSVKSYPANNYKLYDMHGNVGEWCLDWHAPYPLEKCRNPLGPRFGSRKIVRGGSWASDGLRCRSACRISYRADVRNNTVGFRIAIVSR